MRDGMSTAVTWRNDDLHVAAQVSCSASLARAVLAATPDCRLKHHVSHNSSNAENGNMTRNLMAKYLSNVIGNCNVLGAGGCVVVETYDFCKALPLSLLMMWTTANDVIHMCNTLSRYQLTEYYVSSYVYTFFNKIKITPIFGWMDCIARRESLSAPSAVCGPALLCIFPFPTSCSSENDQSNNFIENWN